MTRHLLHRLAVRGTLVPLVLLGALLMAGCASPQEKAMKRTMRDYRRNGKAAQTYAKEQEAQLVAAARAFHQSKKRWPFSADELGAFADQNRIEFRSFAFLRLTFAAMKDGSAQVSYEVDCSRFNTHEFIYHMPGTVRITPP
jgi:hypothetical protein